MFPVILAALLLATACSKGNETKSDHRAPAPPTEGERAQSNANGAPARQDATTAQASAEARVEVAVIQPSEAKLELRLPGEVKGAHDALLASPLGGVVEAVLGREGEAVKPGAVIARIDSARYAIDKQRAEAEYNQARAEMERAKAAADALSAADMDTVRTKMRLAEANLEAAKLNVRRSTISAPFAGILGKIDVEVGEVVAPGAPVVRLIQYTPAKVSVSVADRDIAALKKGMQVNVSIDAAGKSLPGTVSFVSPASDEKTRAFQVEVLVENSESVLKPGMIVSMSVTRSTTANAIVIPQDWIVTKLNGLGVYLDEGGRAKWQPISVGEVIGRQVIVRDGLQTGARVVIKGHRDLAEGDKLLIARVGSCCQNGRAVF